MPLVYITVSSKRNVVNKILFLNKKVLKKFYVNLQSICLSVGKENSDWNQEQGWQHTKVINGRNYVD